MDPGTTVTSPTPVTCIVKSTRDWELDYVASGFDASKGLPLSQLRWGLSPDGSDAQPFASSGTFLAGQERTPHFSVTHYYSLVLPDMVEPGEYSATIVYTAVSH